MMAYLTARELTRLGHEVRLVTQTQNSEADDYPFAVIRTPSHRQLLGIVRWSQAVLQFNVNLKAMWTWALIRRPLVISHQGLYGSPGRRKGLRERVKHLVASRAINIACSPYVAEHLPGQQTVIPNVYDDAMFRVKGDIVRDRDFLFVGRLVSDKGAEDYLNALAQVRRERSDVTATIVGDGVERPALQALGKELGLDGCLQFWGSKKGEELVDAMNRHQFLVVPSRWEEPFGIVALEGMASGCLVIGSRGGGLGYAIGPCGLTFPNRDLPALIDCMKQALDAPDSSRNGNEQASLYLEKFSPAAVARQYENVLLAAVGV